MKIKYRKNIAEYIHRSVDSFINDSNKNKIIGNIKLSVRQWKKDFHNSQRRKNNDKS